MSDATRAVVILREAPGAPALLAAHRLLGLGLADIRQRAAAASPLVDVELFGNDRAEVARMLRALLAALAGLDVAVHVCLGDEEPDASNGETPETLRAILDAHETRSSPELAYRAEPVPELVAAIAESTRRAVEELRDEHPEDFCAHALVTSGEAYRPYLAVTVHGDGRWDLADSPYAITGDSWLARTEPLFSGRGELHRMSTAAAEEEYGRRLASMEAALRRLDDEGLFGRGERRQRVLLLVATMPPDESDAGFARRLNPPGPLLDAWLAEAAEGA